MLVKQGKRQSRSPGVIPRRAGGDGGFTLVELLVTLSILGVVLAALSTSFLGADNAQLRQQASLQAQSEARGALARIRADAACALTASPSGASNDVTLALPSGCLRDVTSGYVEWCVRQNGGGWELWRVANPTVSAGVATPSCQTTRAGALRLMTDVRSPASAGSPFTVTAGAPGSRALPTLSALLAAAPRSQTALLPAAGLFGLRQTIVLANGTRA